MPAAASGATAAPQVQPISGTRLDVSATGEVTRIPDLPSSRPASSPGSDGDRGDPRKCDPDGAGARALKRAGIEDQDIQTSSINLNPEYHLCRAPAAAADRLHGVQPGSTSASATSARPAKSSTPGRRGGQPDQRTEPDHRQARAGARRGAAEGGRERPGAREPTMRGRWACGSPALLSVSEIRRLCQRRRQCR